MGKVKSDIVKINPQMLVWAREAAALSLEDVARKMQFSSGIKKILAFESGKLFPTRQQVFKFSSIYRRPAISFYLNEPPIKDNFGEDFRTISGASNPRKNADVNALVRDIGTRQSMLRSLREDEEAKPLKFMGSMSIDTSVGEAAKKIAQSIDFDPQAPRKKAQVFLDQVRKRIEDIGVFVLLKGDLGSFHSTISPKIFRGFAFSDPIAPMIVINHNDSKKALLFTLFHELTHLWVGASGISSAGIQDGLTVPRNEVETFCNKVSAEILLPTESIEQKIREAQESSSDQGKTNVVRLTAEEFSISEPLVAYTLLRKSAISSTLVRQIVKSSSDRWDREEEIRKSKNKENRRGPAYYTIIASRLGKSVITTVERHLQENSLTTTKAALILGVKTMKVYPLLKSTKAGDIR